MISTKLIPMVAIACVLMFIMPGYVSAASEATGSESIIVQGTSEHADQYTQLVNVADEDSQTNLATWYPTNQGIYIGSSVPESLLQLNSPIITSSTLQVFWEGQFSTSLIMDGVSRERIRIPIYIDSGVTQVGMYVYDLTSDYSIDHIGSGANQFTHLSTTSLRLYESSWSNPASLQYGQDQDFYTYDHRGYVVSNLILEPGVRYLFWFWALYANGARAQLYLAPDDVCSDHIFATNATTTTPETSITPFDQETTALKIDAGVSFDMLQGVSSGLTRIDLNIPAGSILRFTVDTDASGNAYPYVMIPYLSQGPVDCLVQVSYADDDSHQIFAVPDKIYNGYIVASPNYLWNTGSPPEPGLNMSAIEISLIFINATTISLIAQTPIYESWAAPLNGWTLQDMNTGEKISYGNARMLAYFGLASEQQKSPVYWPGMDVAHIRSLEKHDASDYIQLWFSAVASGGLAGMIYYGLTGQSIGAWLYNHIKSAANDINSIIQDIIDTIWDAIQSIGNFLISFGEWLYNALTWIVDAFAQYGQILLGLLIVGVAMLLFFFPVHYQLKIWAWARSLAKGDWNAANRQLDSITSEVSGEIGAVGGVIGRLK